MWYNGYLSRNCTIVALRLNETLFRDGFCLIFAVVVNDNDNDHDVDFQFFICCLFVLCTMYQQVKLDGEQCNH